MTRRERVFRLLQKGKTGPGSPAWTASQVASALGISRCNASRELNALSRQGRVNKIPGKPVRFYARSVEQPPPPGDPGTPEPAMEPAEPDPGGLPPLPGLRRSAPPAGAALPGSAGPESVFGELVGARGSLRQAVRQAQAAVLYPPHGLATLLLGPTGVGKSLFAQIMYRYAVASGRLRPGAPFVAFNCADYAHNPQLLLSQLFGAARGSYTGAQADRPGLVEKADGGVLFLDEIHRLPSEGQEMFFPLLDEGHFRRLGETGAERHASVLLIGATTQDPAAALLETFRRRIPITIHLPGLAERPLVERAELIQLFLDQEGRRMGKTVTVTPLAWQLLLSYECQGNVGQLRGDIQMACADAFLEYRSGGRAGILVDVAHLPERVRRGGAPHPGGWGSPPAQADGGRAGSATPPKSAAPSGRRACRGSRRQEPAAALGKNGKGLGKGGRKPGSSGVPSRAAALLTLCLSREGSAVQLQQWVEERLGSQLARLGVQVIPVSLLEEEVGSTLAALLRTLKVVAVVGTVPPPLPEVPYISLHELVVGDGWRRLEGLLASPGTTAVNPAPAPVPGPPAVVTRPAAALSDIVAALAASLRRCLRRVDADQAVAEGFAVIQQWERETGQRCDPDTAVGVVMHLCCAAERARGGEPWPDAPMDLRRMEAEFPRAWQATARALAAFERQLGVRLPELEAGFLLQALLQRDLSSEFHSERSV